MSSTVSAVSAAMAAVKGSEAKSTNQKKRKADDVHTPAVLVPGSPKTPETDQDADDCETRIPARKRRKCSEIFDELTKRLQEHHGDGDGPVMGQEVPDTGKAPSPKSSGTEPKLQSSPMGSLGYARDAKDETAPVLRDINDKWQSIRVTCAKVNGKFTLSSYKSLQRAVKSGIVELGVEGCTPEECCLDGVCMVCCRTKSCHIYCRLDLGGPWTVERVVQERLLDIHDMEFLDKGSFNKPLATYQTLWDPECYPHLPTITKLGWDDDPSDDDEAGDGEDEDEDEDEDENKDDEDGDDSDDDRPVVQRSQLRLLTRRERPCPATVTVKLSMSKAARRVRPGPGAGTIKPDVIDVSSGDDKEEPRAAAGAAAASAAAAAATAVNVSTTKDTKALSCAAVTHTDDEEVDKAVEKAMSKKAKNFHKGTQLPIGDKEYYTGYLPVGQYPKIHPDLKGKGVMKGIARFLAMIAKRNETNEEFTDDVRGILRDSCTWFCGKDLFVEAGEGGSDDDDDDSVSHEHQHLDVDDNGDKAILSRGR